ncbi:hypothetical protein PAENIP36_37800 [Paenibacillus sp. P36]
METLVDEFERPFIPLGSHPIEERRYTLGTDEISKMYDWRYGLWKAQIR